MLYRDWNGNSRLNWRQAIADPQAMANAALGELLRRLPQGWSVIHMIVPDDEQYDDWTVTDAKDRAKGDARTPDAALTAALGEEQADDAR